MLLRGSHTSILKNVTMSQRRDEKGAHVNEEIRYDKDANSEVTQLTNLKANIEVLVSQFENRIKMRDDKFRRHVPSFNNPTQDKNSDAQTRQLLSDMNQTIDNTITRIVELRRSVEDKNKRLLLYKERLTSEAESKTQSDQTEVEDISHPNRPSKVVEHYTLFTDGRRIRFVEAIETEDLSDENKYKIACDIFKIVYKQASDSFDTFDGQVKSLLHMPVKVGTSLSKDVKAKRVKECPRKQECKDSPDQGGRCLCYCFYPKYSKAKKQMLKRMSNHRRLQVDATIRVMLVKKYIVSNEAMPAYEGMISYLKRTAHTTSLQKIVESSNEEIKRYIANQHNKPRIKSNEMDIYTESCAELCWKMVVQTPKFDIDDSSDLEKHFEKTNHQLPSGSHPPQHNHVIKAYLWPALYRQNDKKKKVYVKPIVSIK